MKKITNHKESALKTVKSTTKRKKNLLFDHFCPCNNHGTIHILLTRIVINENNQHICFKHKCDFQAGHIFPEIPVLEGTSASAHLYKYTPGWWTSNFDEDLYFSKSIFALSVHSSVNPSSPQSPGGTKKLQKLVLIWSVWVIRNSPGNAACHQDH